MAILCCSQDDIIIEKLVSFYGDTSVLALTDMRLLQAKDLDICEVLVIDLKYGTIPAAKNFSLPIVALTGIPNFTECVSLLQRGVKGYCNRQMRQDNLGQAIESVKAGQIWLPPAILSQLIAIVGAGDIAPSDNGIMNVLSEREQEVARYVAEGMSNREMADKMYVSLRTVKAHLSSIYEKTGLRNRLELGLRLKDRKAAATATPALVAQSPKSLR